jgi:LysR family glycine cleavage system transcriptional activator
MANLKRNLNLARRLPPLAWFRAFESSARNLSFTAAAQELGMTQSAISQQINLLEKRFGTQLFVRMSRGLALTDEGRRLVPTVAQAIATLQSASDSFDTKTDRQTLTISTSVSIAQWYLVPRMKDFAKANKDVGIRLMTKVWPDEFADTSVDVEIRFDSIKSAGKNSSPLGSRKSVIVCGSKLLGKKDKSKTALELIGKYPLIQVVGTSDTWQAWAKNHHYSGEINPAVFVDSHGMAVDLAQSGSGIALTSLTIAAPSLCHGTLMQLDDSLENSLDGYHLTVLSSRNEDLSVRFAAWLREEISTTEAQFISGN